MKENIQKLRHMTGCGILDCKKALEATNGSLEEAAVWLRKQGIAKAAKKMDRDTTEGVIGVAKEGTWGALLKVASETDFVARNETFQSFVKEVLALLVKEKPATLDALAQLAMASGETVQEKTTHLSSVIGEPIKLMDLQVVSVDQGYVGSYIHNAYTDTMGTIGVLVGLHSEADPEALHLPGKHLSMHVAASKPTALTRDDLNADDVNKERAFFLEDAQKAGKPEAAIAKIVEGRMRKFFSETVFLEQPFIMEPEKTVEAYVSALPGQVRITGFAMEKIK